MTIGEVAQRSGVAASALRYYEERGLITSERAGSRHRRYPRPVLRRIAFIVFAQRIGLSLEEIRTSLGRLPRSRTPTAEDWARISRSWQDRLNSEIEALTALRDGLDSCIGCGCLSLKRCAISNPRDVAASYGPGAVYLPKQLRHQPST